MAELRYIPLPSSARVPGFLDPPELVAERERRKANSWFLLRNNGEAGERWRCSRCNGKHEYFSLMCLPRPWNGLVEALFAYIQTAPEDPRVPRLALPIMNLAERHPETMKLLKADPEAQELFALSIGIAEPITSNRARLFIEAINASGLRPPLRFAA